MISSVSKSVLSFFSSSFSSSLDGEIISSLLSVISTSDSRMHVLCLLSNLYPSIHEIHLLS